VSWCKQIAGAGGSAVSTARSIALGVQPKLDLDRKGGPADAVWTLRTGGYDDGGAALTVACLRALEHPARVVTGTAGVSPRTWAQVYDGSAWVDVDPLDIDVDGVMKLAHVPLVEGFPGPLTTGLL
jgi:hypothetical protein